MSKNVFEEKRKINDLISSLSNDKTTNKQAEDYLNKLSKFDTELLKSELLGRFIGKETEFNVAASILSHLGDESFGAEILELIFSEKLNDERKAILIQILDDVGFDISNIDFIPAFKDIDSIGTSTLNSFVNELAQGNLSSDKAAEFIYTMPKDAINFFVEKLCDLENENIFTFLERFLVTDDKDLANLIITKLLKKKNVASVYKTIKTASEYLPEGEVKDLTDRALRKMTLKGLKKDLESTKIKLGEIYKILVSNIDGVGSRSLIISRKNKRRIKTMLILINENVGIKDCFASEVTQKQFNDMFEYQETEGVTFIQITYEKAILLLKDALKISEDKKTIPHRGFNFLRPEFLEEKVITPEEYIPNFGKIKLDKIMNDPQLLEDGQKILNIDECYSWGIEDDEDSDEIEVFLSEKNEGESEFMSQKVKKEFIDKFIVKEIPNLQKRLLLTADFLNDIDNSSTKRKRNIKLLLCSSFNISKNNYIPFISRLAEVSLEKSFTDEFMREFFEQFDGVIEEDDFS